MEVANEPWKVGSWNATFESGTQSSGTSVASTRAQFQTENNFNTPAVPCLAYREGMLVELI
jgi:hypothetical protein